MPRAFVLLTAMPPTTGHLNLIRFADRLAPGRTTVLLNTQPHEPLPFERHDALVAAIARCGIDVEVHHRHEVLEQDPAAPGFWALWRRLMAESGMRPGDLIVASEPYGKRLADECGGRFLPYDLDRAIDPVKATPIREDPIGRFAEMLPEFQRHLRTTVTVFGAESTGKTTLSRALADRLGGHWLFEWARPFLEHTSPEITVRSMTDIWHGQEALQRHADDLVDRPYVIQDTDLFSTVGYWRLPHWRAELGDCPTALVDAAVERRSDLYVITRSNIPFEQDPLRYGGTKRESDDQYWIDICNQYALPHLILEASDHAGRLEEATEAIEQLARRKTGVLAYDRHGL